ncbi:hypothetical protein [Wolbachia endosymbiont (group A) of Aleiodes leptofemur]|uniref:hypothetical protein n=1 Tax=Wolbachia endosymbiont (group A) of Aleiodes leptofemur TaxID=3077919 RepID=UPI00333F5B63
MLLACYSHKHISYRIRTIIRKAIDVWSQRVMVYYHHHLRSHYGTDITWVRQNNTDDS